MESPPNFSSATARQSQRDHGFGGDARGRHHAHIGTFVGGLHRFARGEIHRLQRTAQSGNRLQISAHANFLAVGDAAFDSAGVVLRAGESGETVFRAVADFVMHGEPAKKRR